MGLDPHASSLLIHSTTPYMHPRIGSRIKPKFFDWFMICDVELLDYMANSVLHQTVLEVLACHQERILLNKNVCVPTFSWTADYFKS